MTDMINAIREASAEQLGVITLQWAANRVESIWLTCNPGRVIPDFGDNEEYKKCVEEMALACMSSVTFAVVKKTTEVPAR